MTTDLGSQSCSCGSCADTHFFPFILWSTGSLSSPPSPHPHLPSPRFLSLPPAYYSGDLPHHIPPLSDQHPPEHTMSTKVVQQSEGRDTTRCVSFLHPPTMLRSPKCTTVCSPSVDQSITSSHMDRNTSLANFPLCSPSP